MLSKPTALDLGPLPKSDDNAELQRSSLKSLNALLMGQDALLFRDERVEDYGVDGSFELKLHGGMTNLRGQVQLKGVTTVQRNLDGSISLSVGTANLNYLLNGVAPLYILWEATTGAFWYTWAREQASRLQTENLGWHEQRNITLRFTHQLTKAQLPELADKILREGRMHRQLHDSLARQTESDTVVISINPTSLALTDPTQARDILVASGCAIVAAGFATEVIRLFALVGPTSRNLARIRFAVGYAHFTVGEHYNAIGHLKFAGALTEGLSARDKNLIFRIQDAAEFHIGLINSETYQNRLTARASAQQGLEALEAKHDSLYHHVIAEADPRKRVQSVKQLSVLTAEVLGHPDADAGVKLDATLTFLYVQGIQANFDISNQLSSASIRTVLFPYDLLGILAKVNSASVAEASWEEAAQAALKEAYDLRHPVLTIQALTVSLQVRVGRLLSRRLEAISDGSAYHVPAPTRGALSAMFEEGYSLCAASGSVESRLRLRKIEAELLEIEGRHHEAVEVARIAYPEAAAMQFVPMTEGLKEILDNRSIVARYAAEREASENIDGDFERAEMSDEQVARFSGHVVEIVGSPPASPKKVYGYMRTLRTIAQERCTWCRHIQLQEDLRQTSDPESAFSETPMRTVLCDLYEYHSRCESVDIYVLLDDFKTDFCAACPVRKPKLFGESARTL